MNTSCVLCDRGMEARDEDVIVTVNWVLRDIIKKNNIQYDKNSSHIVRLCTECWESLKD